MIHVTNYTIVDSQDKLYPLLNGLIWTVYSHKFMLQVVITSVIVGLISDVYAKK
jgi:uncharacterized membrane protein (DUF106 family)